MSILYSRIGYRSAVVSVLLVYPLWYMFPAMRLNGAPTMAPTVYSDLIGLYNISQVLGEMKFPWSKVHSLNGITGEFLWTPQMLSQSIHYLAIWIFTRFLPEIFAANLYLLLSWVANGLLGYKLARKIGSTAIGSLFTGLLLETVPFVRENLFNWIVYGNLVYFIGVIFCSLKYFEKPNSKNLIASFFMVGTGIFFDIYWLYFGLLTAIVFIVSSAITLKNYALLRKIFIVSLVSFFTSGLVFSKFVSLVQRLGPNSRKLEITEISWIDSTNSNPVHIVFGNDRLYGHVGLTVFCLFLAAIFIAKQKSKISLVAIFLLVISLHLSLTTQSSMNVWGVRIPLPITYFRYLFPGVRFFERAGFVAVVFICLLAGLAISWIIPKFKTTFLSFMFVMFCSLLVVRDYQPFSGRHFDFGSRDFRTALDKLGIDPTGVVELPATNLDGTRLSPYPRIPLHYLSSPRLFSIRSEDWLNDLALYGSRGNGELENYLLFSGISHVFVPDSEELQLQLHDWKATRSVQYDLNSERFKFVGTIESPIQTRIFEIVKESEDYFCSSCEPFDIEFSGVESNFGKYFLNGNSLERDFGGQTSWVNSNDSFGLTIKNTNSESNFSIQVDLVPFYGSMAKSNVVVVSNGVQNQAFILRPGQTSSVQLNVTANSPIFFSSSLGCSRSKDIDPLDLTSIESRYCFGVADISVREIP